MEDERLSADHRTKHEGAVRTVAVFTHAYPQETAGAFKELLAVAEEKGIEIWASPEETRKHEMRRSDAGAQSQLIGDVQPGATPDLCLAMGGDGTILAALRAYVGRQVPVFGINYGRLGFLAATGRDHLRESILAALSGEFVTLDLPALAIDAEGQETCAFNDIALLRMGMGGVAELSFSLGGEEVSSVRCDGMVVSTPAGSTGYNLANGGPVMAWGVEGFVTSFIAPHTLTARPLVIAPNDSLRVRNNSPRKGIEIAIDGRQHGEIGPFEEVEIGYRHHVGRLAQMPGETFYKHFRAKFGLLFA